MKETWEQTKQRLKMTIGVSVTPEPVVPVVRARYDEAVPEVLVALYEVRKITLPVDLSFPNGKVILSNLTRQEADHWIEKKLKVKSNADVCTFYEKFLIGASVRESSIYSNPEIFCTEDFPEWKR